MQVLGTGFTGVTEVAFEGHSSAAFTVDSDSTLTVEVPVGAASGGIALTNAAGSDTSATDFVVIRLPVVSSFTPSSGPPGTSVSLAGHDLLHVTSILFGGTSTDSFVVESDSLIQADVPAGAVLTTAELVADPYLRKRGTFVTVEHPVRGPVLMPGFPLKMSASSVPILPAPLLGQHNEEVYAGMLGVPADELERLHQAGVI